MIRRHVNILQTNSFFLFGARGTGKTYLIHALLKPVETIFIDLLDPEQVDRFSIDPNELRNITYSLPTKIQVPD